MRNLEPYQIDELVDLLKEFRYRSENDPDIQDEIDSVLDMLEPPGGQDD